ncbi:MAG: DUF2975 domain-containing protein [Nesterenkonia sp.]
MTTLHTTLLKVTLILLLLGSLVVQVLLIPLGASQTAQSFPEVEHLAAPYAVLAILAILGLQVGMFATWRLVTMVSHDSIFDLRALKWVDVVLAALATATALTFGVFLHLMLIVQVGNLTVHLGLAGSATLGLAVLLLLVVMRRLLVQAIEYRAELDEVV